MSLEMLQFLRKILSHILLGGVCLLWVGCSGSEVRLETLGPESVILAFGDSLTFGTGASPQSAYPQVLARRLGLQVVNFGRPGETSGEGLRRLPGVLEEVGPDLVILCHGGNDFLRRLDVAQLEQNLREMVRLCRQAGAEVVLVAVPELGFGLSPAQLYKNLASELNLVFEEESLTEILKKPALKSDRIHPNDRGYEMLAQALADRIERAQRR